MKFALVLDELESYVREEFLEGDRSAELTGTTPLLEWGILDSMKTARLITFVRVRFDVTVPFQEISAANFLNLECIARMVLEIQAQRTKQELRP